VFFSQNLVFGMVYSKTHCWFQHASPSFSNWNQDQTHRENNPRILKLTFTHTNLNSIHIIYIYYYYSYYIYIYISLSLKLYIYILYVLYIDEHQTYKNHGLLPGLRLGIIHLIAETRLRPWSVRRSEKGHPNRPCALCRLWIQHMYSTYVSIIY
jgi:hypothetical protein